LNLSAAEIEGYLISLPLRGGEKGNPVVLPEESSMRHFKFQKQGANIIIIPSGQKL